MNRKRWLILAALAVALPVVVVLGYQFLFQTLELGGVNTLTVRPVEVVPAKQGWDPKGTREFHHRSQGTKILPLKWFMALERPVLTPLPAGRYASREYLSRFGFIYDDGPPWDEFDLPIGFAIEDEFLARYAVPPIETRTRVVGLTCAACHTGRLDVKGPGGAVKGVIVEGGSAMIHVAAFQTATGLALGYTDFFPQRFNRFAARVLDADLPATDPRKVRLRRDLKTFLDTGQADKNYAKDHKLNPIEPGFARTDALGLIGNRVFKVLSPENQVVTDAPVNFPHIWDTAWFDWVQYNASIRMPMARNIGEALGVGALVNLDPNKGKLFDSTVNVGGLQWMEWLLGGEEPFQGLQPPKWDAALFGPIKPAFAAEGRKLYLKHCATCHLPPRDELKADLAAREPHFFVVDKWAGKRFLRLPVLDLFEIGTDPNQAMNFYRRVAVMTKLPDGKKTELTESVARDTIPAKVGLFLLTSLIRRDKYEQLGLLAPGSPDTIKDLNRLKEFDRYRSLPNELVVGDQGALFNKFQIDDVISASLGYKARPLDGVWATPPFLHNGSVPNLYQMFLPVSRRDAVFYLGSKFFDPTHVGYQTHQVQGATKTDTSVSGNHNTGHEFRNMTLEELEQAQNVTPDPNAEPDARWSVVLGLPAGDLSRLSATDRWARVRLASREARKLPHYVPARGVLGVEFSDEERWQIVEYLKTL